MPSLIKRAQEAATYMIRGIRPDTWFSPGQPLQPMTNDPTVKGRQFDYNASQNINFRPRATEIVGFRKLKILAESSNLLRIVIERQKDLLEAFEWQIMPKAVGGKRPPNGTAQKQIDAMTKLLEEPEPGYDWAQWLRRFLEQVYVYDALTIYPRMTLGGGPFALDLIDGSSITPLLDASGRRPVAPSPAYEQILKGIIVAQFGLDELIYFPKNPRVDRIYGYCYDAETEIMTERRGWVKFADLSPHDRVATRSDAGEFEWQTPDRVIRHQWDGEMIAFKSRTMDLLVTPEHRMLVTALPRPLGGNRSRDAGEAIITADQFARFGNREIKIPVTSWWAGEEVEAKSFAEQDEKLYEITRKGNGGRETYMRRKTPVRTVEMSGDDYCALMGAYIAEGNIRSAGGIEVAQLEKSKGYELYRALFNRLGGGYSGRAFVLPRRAITDHFRQFGLAHEKSIPAEIMNATPRQLQIFFDHYMAGDGYFKPHANISGRGKNPKFTMSAITVSKPLADQLCEIAQKLGMSASVKVKPAHRQLFLKRYYSECRQAYRVYFRRASAMSVTASRHQYNGEIHCVEVPNGIVYVRRNGKPAWCGNSRVQQIVDTVETEIERMKSQKAYFTMGNTTDGIFTGPTEWTTDQIKTWQSYWDDLFSGNVEARRHGWWVPGGTEWHEIKQPPLKDMFDEWLARKICFAFSTNPGPFIEKQNRSNQESQQEVAEEGGIANDMAFIKRVMDRVIKFLGYTNIEFVWSEDREFDPQVAAQIDDMQLKNGSKAVNEVRERLGLDPIPDGDTPMLFGGAGGWMKFDDVINPPDPPAPVIMGHNGGPPLDPNAPPGPVLPPAPKNGAPDTKKVPKKVPAKSKALKKSAPIPLRSSRPGMAKTIATTRSEVAKALKKAGTSAAHQVHRALLTLGKADGDDPKETAATVAAGVDLSDLGAVADALEPALSETATAAGTETVASVGVDNPSKLVDQVNLRAVVFARDRAAELVGKRYDSAGELIDNPDPEWAIDEPTRTWLRDTIAKGLEDNIGADAIRDQIAGHYAFSEDRADVITRTEIARANSQGGLEGAREAVAHGVVMKKIWLVTNSDNCCFPAGVMISTPSGDVPVQNLRKGSAVLNRDGVRNTLAASARRFFGQMVVIRTADGRILPTTEDHPILVRGDWVEARAIEPGDLLQTVEHKFTKVVAVAHIDLLDANNRPSCIGEKAVAARVTSFVAVPEGAIDFDCDTIFFEREVDGVSADLKFLGEGNPENCECRSDRALDGRFAAETTIAPKSTKPPGRSFATITEFSPTMGAGDYSDGSVAAFRTESLLAGAAGLEGEAAPIARSADLRKPSALDYRALGSRRVIADAATKPATAAVRRNKEFSTCSACGFPSQPLSNAVATARTKDLVGAASLKAGKLRTALAAIISEGHEEHLGFCDEIERNGCVRVFNLQVAGTPEFFANGIAVHNCDDCEDNADDGAIDLDDDFTSGADAPPEHPNCQCSLSWVVETDDGDEEGDGEED